MMDELDTNFLRDERNWFFQEKFPRGKIMESAVWPAKVTHQRQVRIHQPFISSKPLFLSDQRS